MKKCKFFAVLLIAALLSGCGKGQGVMKLYEVPETKKAAAATEASEAAEATSASEAAEMPETDGTSETLSDESSETYLFSACDPSLLPVNRAWLRGLYEYDGADKHSLFVGQVLSLFGEPDYITDDNENLFSKAVCAMDKHGNTLYLEVYYGPSGPAIGGEHSGDNAGASAKAADELAALIMTAEPSDFEWESVYMDIGVTVIMGVKDGKPYYDTVFPEDFEDMF